MSDRWTDWKSFPDDFYGEFIQAPLGPGLYEVCRSSTREQVAFGCTRNVAEALGDLLRPRGLKSGCFSGAGGATRPASLNTAPGRPRRSPTPRTCWA